MACKSSMLSNHREALVMSVRFQWVKCQLDALGRCLSRSHLRTALRSLPKDLDDTYARILRCIDNNGYGKEVAKIMQWLAYSRQPMSLTEVSEVLTVDPEENSQFDIERRLVEPHELLRMCSSLVTTVRMRRVESSSTTYEDAEEEEVLQLAQEGMALGLNMHSFTVTTSCLSFCLNTAQI